MAVSEPAAIERVEALRAHWRQYQQEHERAFKYDAALAFGASEAELLAAECGGAVTRLEGDWKEVLTAFSALGRVMTLTRNHNAVHEKKGRYQPVSFSGHVGLVLDEGVDLRLFMQNWAYGFAVENPNGKRYKHSFQFFGPDGSPVHKVFAAKEGENAFKAIRDRFKAPSQSPVQPVRPGALDPAPPRPDAEIDRDGLRAAWAALEDTHDFFPMLKKFDVRRTQAHRLAGAPHAERLETAAYRAAIETAAARELPIMIFAGNPGCIQIHTGEVKKLLDFPGWFNIMDPGFNLHLRENGVSETWLTRKPTKDGVVTAVELFDAEGRDIALIFGKRKPGIPELPEWRGIAENLPRA